jgi:hypothetical protein
MTATAEAIVQVLGPRAKSVFVSNAGGLRCGHRNARWRGAIVRAGERLTLVLAATVLFKCVIFAHPTPDERARLHDTMGQSTGIAWR